jgi:hypothetical protein
MSRKAPTARTATAMNALASDPPVAGRVAGSVVGAALVGATAALVGGTGALVEVVGAVVGVVGAVVGATVVGATVVEVVVVVPSGRMAKGELASCPWMPPASAPVAATTRTRTSTGLTVTVRVCGPPPAGVQSHRTCEEARVGHLVALSAARSGRRS